jgi:hypothetical protein
MVKLLVLNASDYDCNHSLANFAHQIEKNVSALSRNIVPVGIGRIFCICYIFNACRQGYPALVNIKGIAAVNVCHYV